MARREARQGEEQGEEASGGIALMADFCKQCSIEIFGEDLGDMRGLCGEGFVVSSLCEHCGAIYVDHDGVCYGRGPDACIEGHDWPKELLISG